MIEIHGKHVYTDLEELIDPSHTALLVIDMQDVHGNGLSIGCELIEDRASKSLSRSPAARSVYPVFGLGEAAFYVGKNS